MLNKNFHLIVLILIMSFIFTLVIGALFQFNSVIGCFSTFLLIGYITIFLLKTMIEEKYRLLSSLPKSGQTVNPFQIILLGKTLWQYPAEGMYVFDKSGMTITFPVQTSDSEISISPLKKPKEILIDDGFEMDLQIFKMTKKGRKSDRTEEEWSLLVKEWLAVEHIEKQEIFCRRHNIGTARTFRNYIKKYRDKQ